jgi:molybdate transport system substrate-binding protein
MKKLKIGSCFVSVLLLYLLVCGMGDNPKKSNGDFKGKELELFIGSASKPAAEDAAKEFEKLTGAKLLLHFGGSGKMLSDMKLSNRGDIYFPGSSDYMELAKREKLVIPETEKIVVYLIPAINVPKGNPKGIKTLDDLAKPGVRIGIARPDTVCVGLYAVEVLEYNNLSEKVKPNIVTYVESCEKTAQIVGLSTVDAVIGWSVFCYWNPEKIETVLLDPEQVPRVGYIPIARSVYSKEKKLSDKFIEYVTGKEGKSMFEKWNYFVNEKEAKKYAKKGALVGGEWKLPDKWK